MKHLAELRNSWRKHKPCARPKLSTYPTQAPRSLTIYHQKAHMNEASFWHTFTQDDVDKTGEDDDAQDEEEDEEGEFLRRGLEGVDKNLEPARVSCQLEQSQDPYDAEKLNDLRRLSCVVL
ncbi:hypothetical protein E2C01_026083 [Portunus trituberculatus]|uniref:Uncharacterized protein n=1 Tax=Portunus trituberculatus TaxID=210409 RepID=A0A5B7EH82_PORTR|nr:hypothetical protein [Portunus trituberculatus]